MEPINISVKNLVELKALFYDIQMSIEHMVEQRNIVQQQIAAKMKEEENRMKEEEEKKLKQEDYDNR